MNYGYFAEILSSLVEIANTKGEDAALATLESALEPLKELSYGLSPEEERKHIGEFRRSIHPIYLTSEFGSYVFTRPRGYPGDFMTQELIWRGRTKGGEERYRGSTETGKLLTALTLDMHACYANEIRMRRLAAIIASNDGASVASIGCGSAIEYTLLNGAVPSKVFLLDQDTGALAKARENPIFRDLAATFCEENIVKFILRNQRCKHLGDRDLIYAFGLFDYFPVKIAQRIVAALWVSLLPGGKLLVTNAHPGNPTRLWMEWGGEWYLDYKTKHQMHALAEGLEAVAHVEYDIDDCGVYQYFEIQKDPWSRRVRPRK